MAVDKKQLGSKLSYNDINEMLTLFPDAESIPPEKLYDGQIWLKLGNDGPELMRYNQGIDQWENVGGVTQSNLLSLLLDRDGSGSGLDADLLDGMEAGEFLQRNNNGACIDITGQDLNNITSSGMYKGNAVLNAPSTGWFYFMVFKHTDDYILQFAFGYWGSYGFWIRRNLDNNWANSWEKLWFEGNQGALSGMDSDMLDGHHGSFYRNASNMSSGTLPLTRVPDVLTGKDADSVDGLEGTQLLRSDTEAKVQGAIISEMHSETIETNGIIDSNIKFRSTGLLFVRSDTHAAGAIFEVATNNTTYVNLLHGNAVVFSNTKDTASKINIYFDGDYLKIQNKKSASLIRVGFTGCRFDG